MDLLYIKKCCDRIRQDSIYPNAFCLPWDARTTTDDLETVLDNTKYSIIDTVIHQVSLLPDNCQSNIDSGIPFTYNGFGFFLDADVSLRKEKYNNVYLYKLNIFMNNLETNITLSDDYSHFKIKVKDHLNGNAYRGFADDLNLKIPSLTEETKGFGITHTARGYHIYPDMPLSIEYGPAATSDERNQ